VLVEVLRCGGPWAADLAALFILKSAAEEVTGAWIGRLGARAPGNFAFPIILLANVDTPTPIGSRPSSFMCLARRKLFSQRLTENFGGRTLRQ
jgi:hypothetical protein